MSEFKKIPLPFTHRWVIEQNTHPGWRTELLVTLQRVWPAKDIAWFGAEADDESTMKDSERATSNKFSWAKTYLGDLYKRYPGGHAYEPDDYLGGEVTECRWCMSEADRLRFNMPLVVGMVA